MCDQTIPYATGTYVWAQLLNKIWWPGKIVEVSSIPKELEYYKRKNKNAKTAVYFHKDKSYELIVKLDRLFLYSCPKKMEFIEKGYLLYLKQKKSGLAPGGFDMTCFVEDVLNVEKNIGGDINIFDVVIKKQQEQEENKIKHINMQMNIKDLFMTEKERKKREKNERRSVTSSANTSKSSIKNTPAQGARETISKLPVTPQGFYCPYCDNFSTNRYAILKLHMDAHKNESTDMKNKETPVIKKPQKAKKSPSIFNTSNPRSRSSTPRKRKTTKTKVADTKKIKLQDELLKDWDDEDLDEDETETENIQSEAQDQGSSEDYLSLDLDLQFDDLPGVPMTTNEIEMTPDNVKMTPLITEIDTNRPIDDDDLPITICFPKCHPVKTDEELISSKEFHDIMEIANNGGDLYLKIESPFCIKK